ncbi:MAG: PAQR family membrane homeostasis protein TrhA [Acidimicrobiales bacterium]
MSGVDGSAGGNPECRDTGGNGRAADDAGEGSGGTSQMVKPKLRGVSHLVAFVVSLVTGPVLIMLVRGTGNRLAVSVYALATSCMFGASALLHRGNWSPRIRQRLRKLDHSMIFFMIAGSYTAVVGLALPSLTATVVLAVVWAGALGGIAAKIVRVGNSKWVTALPYLLLGWVAVVVLPGILHALGVIGLSMMVLGGAFYTLGGLVYARRRPDPWPATFGFHEIFHALVIAGSTTMYLLVALVVVPAITHAG